MASSNESWEKFLHPKTLKNNLITISLFITAFENFKESVISKPVAFFCDGFNEYCYIIDEKYKTEVLSLSKSKLYATLLWLKTIEAIDQQDIVKFDAIKRHRNEIAHETMQFLADADKNFDVTKFTDLIALLTKIEKWWFLNFEASIDPEMLPEGADVEDVVPGAIWSLQLMLDIALGDEPTAGYYYNAYKEKTI